MWSARARSTSYSPTATIFWRCFGPASVPETDTSSPSARVPRTVTTLRCSGDSELVVSRTSTPRSWANSGALTYDTVSSTTSSKTPLRADSSSTFTSCWVISP